MGFIYIILNLKVNWDQPNNLQSSVDTRIRETHSD